MIRLLSWLKRNFLPEEYDPDDRAKLQPWTKEERAAFLDGLDRQNELIDKRLPTPPRE